MSCGGYSLPQFKVVSQVIDNSLKAANRFQHVAAHCHRRAESKTDAPFNLPSSQHACGEIGGDAIGFEFGSHASGRNAAIHGRHQTHFRVGKVGEYASQIISRDTDVAIVHHHKVVACMSKHLDHIADLAVRAQHLRTNHQADIVLREFRHKLAHKWDSFISEVTHAEDDLVLAVVLQAVTAQARVDLRVRPLERLQDG